MRMALIFLAAAFLLVACKRKAPEAAQTAPAGTISTGQIGTPAPVATQTAPAATNAAAPAPVPVPVPVPGKEVTIALTEKIAMRLTLIPAGKFIMGVPKGEQYWVSDYGRPQHEVTISRAFY